MQTSAPGLSIIMPVRNESQRIDAALQALKPLRLRGVQVVVVDGGSTDGTLALARQALGLDTKPNHTGIDTSAGSQALGSAPGRALQMNTGALQAMAPTLLFLHADTQLPPDADALVAQALAGSARVWGRFDVHIAGQHWMLRVIAACMNIRSRCTGIATGDQALFMTRAAFDAVGGFPDQPLMEDIEMSSRLGHLSRPICLRTKVITSGRRWETCGVWRTVLLMWRLRFAYWRGAAPDRLARLYQ
ncbi:MAG: TIGR04283 family arsenosugar biosynthesis glycosyltransferase [Rhodoferax sp.]|jgi:rSAM/selenodomain-associated transferase 2